MRGRYRAACWRGYRLAWTGAFGSACALGIVGAGVTLPVATIAGLFAAVALTFGSSVWAWTTVSLLPERLAVSAAVWGGVVAVSTQGLAATLGPWSLAVLLALCLGTPGGLVWLRDRLVERRPFDDPGARGLLDPRPATQYGPDLSRISSADLERVWHLSGARLHLGPEPLELAHLVALRGACLDEMELRDPARLRQWLEVDAS